MLLAPFFFRGDIGHGHRRIRARPHKQYEGDLRDRVEDALDAPPFQPARSLQSSLRGGHLRQHHICSSFQVRQVCNVHGGACRPRAPTKPSSNTGGQGCTARRRILAAYPLESPHHTTCQLNAPSCNPAVPARKQSDTQSCRAKGSLRKIPAVDCKPGHDTPDCWSMHTKSLGQQISPALRQRVPHAALHHRTSNKEPCIRHENCTQRQRTHRQT